MRCALLLFLFIWIFDSPNLTTSCPIHCGNISIRFPFGIGKGCYYNDWFEIECNNSNFGKVVLYQPKLSKEVVSFGHHNTPFPSVRIKNNITSLGCSNSTEGNTFDGSLNLTNSPFYIGRSNHLVAIGCNNKATLRNSEPRPVECITSCKSRNTLKCSNGNGCYCQSNIPKHITVYGISIQNSLRSTRGGCKVAFLTDEFNRSVQVSNFSTDPQWFYDREYTTIQLRYVIPENLSSIESFGCAIYNSDFGKLPCSCYNYSTSTVDIKDMRCECNGGYKGNPYVFHGCKDIDECQQLNKCAQRETCVNTQGSYYCKTKKNKTLPITIGFSVCFGALIFVGVCFSLYRFIKRIRKIINRKKKFFKRNGGLLLQQQLISSQGTIDKTIIFSSKELKKATENFSLNRVLGQGGQGTVYKGMLTDGKIIAVKKSKVVDEDKLEEFINEVVILSQINHRNIVKLLGCCLETKVPLLVYEFIPNGNLFELLHNEFDDYNLASWEVRLHIAIDIAGALSYLHSATSSPIYHRDIKTTNIMLDEKYRAKVSDFGTSRSVTVDHTHLTTVVSGTIGYVDPEYYQSSQFTDKSDVYSFGVVLVELITGEKPVSFLRSQENRTLATYFILAMKKNNLIDIIDPRIKEFCKQEQVMAVAKVAKRCLNLKGKKRPNMREVSMELERIRSPIGDSSQPHGHIIEDEVEEIDEDFNIGLDSDNNVSITVPSGFKYDVSTTSPSFDVEPLFPRTTW